MVTIHWTSYVFVAIALGCISYSKAQESVHPKTITPPATVHTAIQPVAVPTVPLGGRPLGQPVVMIFENGGHIGQHRERFFNYQRDGDRVELRGACYSACTLVTGYVPRDMICVAPGAFMAFHAAQTGDVPPQRHYYGTATMYNSWPEHIREWIDRQGGREKLPGPGAGYWTLYDRDLWAMGYPRCK